MNITTASNSTSPPDLCPLDSRRSNKEIWVKLLVVHITTIAAFCHLLSLRKEPIFRWKLIFYILVPYSIFAKHIALVLWALYGLICYTIRPSVELRNGLWRTASWFFGVVPAKKRQYELLPSSEWEIPVHESDTETVWKRCGRILLAGAFFAQCIGTMILFSRRQSRQAATIADYKVLELGSTGILTATCWLAYLLKIPAFAESIPSLRSDTQAAYEKGVIWLRDCPRRPLISDSDDAPNSMSFFANGIIAFIILSATRKMRIAEYIVFEAKQLVHGNAGSETSHQDYSFEMVMVIIAMCIGAVVSIVTCCGKPQSKTARLRGQRQKPGDIKPWWMWFCCPVGVATLWFPILFVLGPVFVIIYALPTDVVKVYEQTEKLAAWSANTTCPLLWSDPAAGWIWALA